jgi:hypothetical protein
MRVHIHCRFSCRVSFSFLADDFDGKPSGSKAHGGQKKSTGMFFCLHSVLLIFLSHVLGNGPKRERSRSVGSGNGRSNSKLSNSGGARATGKKGGRGRYGRGMMIFTEFDYI